MATDALVLKYQANTHSADYVYINYIGPFPYKNVAFTVKKKH